MRYTTAGIVGGNPARQRWADTSIKDEKLRYFVTGLNEDPNLVHDFRLSSCVYRAMCEFDHRCLNCNEFHEIERPMI